MDLFLLKKVITVLVMPVTIISLLLLTAILLHRFKPKLSLFSLVMATTLLLLATLPPVSNRVMTQLENEYPAYLNKAPNIDYIVVLGCGHTSSPTLPVTSQLGVCSLERSVEALRIYNLHPNAKIITSGYAGNDSVTNAEKVKQALMLLGVPQQDILADGSSRDTEEEAKRIYPMVKDADVILITNASHMPRAMNYFKSQGLDPIPAPTGYWVKNSDKEKTWKYYLPHGGLLAQTTTAWYETLGQFVQWLKSM